MTMTTINRTQYLNAAQKSLETTIARGETLLTADGYTIEPYADRPGVYMVARPENDPRPLPKGSSAWNDVDVLNQECTCAAFEFHGTCKHLIATNKAVAEAARLMAPLLPTQDKPAKRGFASKEDFARAVAADFG